MPPDFSIRSTLPEKMDQPGVPEAEVRKALREIGTINKYLGGYSLIFSALNGLHLQGRATIMDIGSGGGDMLRAIAAWAKKKNKEVNLVGVDWNPIMTEYAAECARQFPNIHFKTLSVFDDGLMEEAADVTMCSLFCHHFEHAELVALIKRMHALAKEAVIINDLHRTRVAYYSIKLLTAIFSKTFLVKYDAPLSVARAFSRKELREVMVDAGITNYTLRWRWAWRWELIIKK